jgi:hypothetical protein
MTDFNQQVDQAKDVLNLEQKDMNQLPSMLNVLTILTYIGSALAAISAVYTYFTVEASYKLLQGYNQTGNELGGSNSFVQSILSKSQDIVRRSYENRTLILALTLIGAVLCFYGAMQMRNLKKIGFPIYAVGEVLPIATSFLLIGGGALAGFGLIGSALIPVVFITLYATQRKYLVK